jgi:hypothetical protein
MEDSGKLNLKVALTLALAVLTSWEEDDRREPDKKIQRAWKGYLFEVMNDLEQRGFIRSATNSRSMQITDAGIVVGGDLVKKMREAFAAFIAGN